MNILKNTFNEKFTDNYGIPIKLSLVLSFICIFGFTKLFSLYGQNIQISSERMSTIWHGFERFDYLMDLETFAIKPILAAEDEKCENNDQTDRFHKTEGQRRCLIVLPKVSAPGKPWLWRGYYFGHEPQVDIELLKRGYHLCYVFSNPDETWDEWYTFVIKNYGLSKKPSFTGMSRGGSNSFAWATANPDKVTCIYGDNPGISRESLLKLGELIKNDVPILCVCGSIDPMLENNALIIENFYQQLGGEITMMIQEGLAHHPHSMRDPKPIADFIEKSFNKTILAPPEFAGKNYIRSYFYGTTNFYINYPSENTYITCRGPLFSGSYNRYEFRIAGNFRVIMIAPRKEAPEKPWVFRTDFVSRDDKVDLALLAEGYHIVIGPVPTNADGPLLEQWNIVYKFLTDHGFSKKPVLKGAGGAAGEVYAWAIANPNQVSCIYGENPILKSKLAKIQPVDNLAPLAEAKVPLMHVCGSLDPWFNENTSIARKLYKKLGGKMTVIIQKGEGHYPLGLKDPKPVIDFIKQNTQ